MSIRNNYRGNNMIRTTQKVSTFIGAVGPAGATGLSRGDWATGTVYNLVDIVKDTTTNNIYVASIAHTSVGTQPLTTNADSGKWNLLVDVYSTTASAAAALVSEGLADADATQTAADRVVTTQDAIDTAADVVLTNADVVLTNADVVSAEADKVQTGLDRTDTAADLVATNQDTIDTAADVVLTHADVLLTNADELLTRADTVLTAADVVTTNADVVLTNADVVSTGNSATAAASSYDSFDDRYLGTKAADPTLDNDGDALVAGALFFDTVATRMKVYSGSAWQMVAPTSTSNLFDTVAVAGQSDVVAGSTTDTLTLAAAEGITLTTNAATDTVTISSTIGATNGFVIAMAVAL